MDGTSFLYRYAQVEYTQSRMNEKKGQSRHVIPKIVMSKWDHERPVSYKTGHSVMHRCRQDIASYKVPSVRETRCLLLLGGGSGLEDSLDDVSLLDEECSGDPIKMRKREIIKVRARSQHTVIEITRKDRHLGPNSPVLDTTSTSGTTVSSRNGLLSLGDGSVGSGSERWDTSEGLTTVTALGSRRQLLEVVDDELASGGLDDPPSVGGRVVRLSLSEGNTLSHLRRDGENRKDEKLVRPSF